MKRALTILLVLFLLAGFAVPAGAADSYILPEPLKTVPGSTKGLSLPGELPPDIPVRTFSVDEDGSVHLELESKVPRLKILEKNLLEGVESTIFTKKNTSAAEAHMSGKENSAFTVRMIWPLGSMEFVRDYASLSDSLNFVSCSASEEADPAAFAPYTSAVRTLFFNMTGTLLSETWTLENDNDRFIRIAAYDEAGNLISVKETWESVKPGLYRNELELDGSGNLIGITAEGQKNSFFALSMRVGENPDFAMIISEASADPSEFDDQLEEKYPQVESGDFDFTSLNGWSEEFLDEWNVNPAASDDKEDEDDWDDEEEDEEDDEEDEEKPASARDSDKPRDPRFPPIPANARVWSVNFTAPFDEYVFAFITEDYPFLLNNGKVSLNSKARDVSRRALKFGQLKMNVPMMEPVTIE